MTTLTFRDLALRAPDGQLLLDGASASLEPGFTGLVGANGAGKSTLLRTLAGLLAPASGEVRRGRMRLVQPQGPRQALDDALAALSESLHGASSATRRDVARLLPHPLDAAHASPGECARAWLAVAAATSADAWLLDEPSAHLDAEGRHWLRGWLARCDVPVLVASHDRALLAGADRIWELSNARLTTWGGGFEAYFDARRAERERAEASLQRHRREQRALEREAQAARERADRRAARGAAEVRKGSQGKLLAGYLQGRAEHGRGAQARAAAARLESAVGAVQAARERLALEPDFRLDLGGFSVPAGKRLLVAEGLSLLAGERCLLRDFDLVLQGPRRLALQGPNGSGKSRLLRALAGVQPSDAGRVLPGTLPIALVDQQGAGERDDDTVLRAFLRRQPMPEGAARERLAWFLFTGVRVFQPVGTLSAGERLRLALACQLGGPALPGLLLLDEPDNHLDLPSQRAVEQALAQYPGGLVVVSHDEAFLAAAGVGERLRLGG